MTLKENIDKVEKLTFACDEHITKITLFHGSHFFPAIAFVTNKRSNIPIFGYPSFIKT